MYLDATNKSLEVVLAGAVTTNQAKITTDWADNDTTTFTPGNVPTVSNNTTPVTIVTAPAVGVQRIVKEINIFNFDTAQMTVTVHLNVGGILTPQITATIQPGERIYYNQNSEWAVYDTFGAKKVTAVQNVVEPGYIDGNILIWNSGTSFSVSGGSCYIPSLGRNLNAPTTITRAGLVLTANTFYHVYRFLNLGVPDIEYVTTVPSSPYEGTARTKTGDPSRRYLGSFRTDSGGNIVSFVLIGNTYTYRAAGASFRVLSAGSATVATLVSCASVVPVTAQAVTARFINNAAGGGPSLLVADGSAGLSASAYVVGVAAGGQAMFATCPLDGSLQLAYMYTAAAGSGFIDIQGYSLDR